MDLLLILLNNSCGIYSIPKELKYIAVSLSINNETQCVPLLFLSSGFITNAINPRLVIEILKSEILKYLKYVIEIEIRITISLLYHLYIIIEGNTNNRRIPPSSPFPALVTLFLDIAFINEEATGCISEEAIDAINEAAIGAIIVPGNLPSCVLYFIFYCFSSTIN